MTRVEIAGPGFINFHLGGAAFHAEVAAALAQGADYGRQPARSTPKILLEFVSANPTGPLHVGHGRHAAYGASVGNLLEAAGYPVTREYYVNDAGRQMDILGASVWLRHLELHGIEVPFPRAGYRGGYIRDIAAAIDTTGVTQVAQPDVLAGLPEDGPKDAKDATAEQREANRAQREAYVEAIIAKAKALLGEDGFDHVRQQSLDAILDEVDGILASDPDMDLERFIDTDTAFHRRIAQASGNPALAGMIDSLVGRTHRARLWRAITERGTVRETQGEHRAILAELKAHDPERARIRMAVHILGVEEFATAHAGDEASDPAP